MATGLVRTRWCDRGGGAGPSNTVHGVGWTPGSFGQAIGGGGEGKGRSGGQGVSWIPASLARPGCDSAPVCVRTCVCVHTRQASQPSAGAVSIHVLHGHLRRLVCAHTQVLVRDYTDVCARTCRHTRARVPGGVHAQIRMGGGAIGDSSGGRAPGPGCPRSWAGPGRAPRRGLFPPGAGPGRGGGGGTREQPPAPALSPPGSRSPPCRSAPAASLPRGPTGRGRARSMPGARGGTSSAAGAGSPSLARPAPPPSRRLARCGRLGSWAPPRAVGRLHAGGGPRCPARRPRVTQPEAATCLQGRGAAPLEESRPRCLRPRARDAAAPGLAVLAWPGSTPALRTRAAPPLPAPAAALRGPRPQAAGLARGLRRGCCQTSLEIPEAPGGRAGCSPLSGSRGPGPTRGFGLEQETFL